MNLRTQAKILGAIDANNGVLTPSEAERFGIHRPQLTEARNIGVIDRPLRGVYTRPGVRLSPARLGAARLGPPAVLSHRGAADAYGLDAVPSGILEWSVPHARHKPAPNVYLRRSFGSLDVVERDGLLVTSITQTLCDLGTVIDVDALERAAESALRMELTTDAALRAFATGPGRHMHGVSALREVLERRWPWERPTGSDIGTILLQVYRHGGVERPIREFEIWQGDVLVARPDCHWYPIPFGTEVDGFASHGTKPALQYDLNRSNRIGDARHFERRFTFEDVTRRQRYVCDETLRGLAIARELFPKCNQIAWTPGPSCVLAA
jgi:hypothetical protein